VKLVYSDIDVAPIQKCSVSDEQSGDYHVVFHACSSMSVATGPSWPPPNMIRRSVSETDQFVEPTSLPQRAAT
jgi:hypothetical protein